MENDMKGMVQCDAQFEKWWHAWAICMWMIRQFTVRELATFAPCFSSILSSLISPIIQHKVELLLSSSSHVLTDHYRFS